MRKLAIAFAAAALVGCSIFGGSGGPDPLAGWGGLWTGEYEGGGGYGALEVQLSVDTAGTPAGVIGFDRGFGMESYPAASLFLTQDSITTEVGFEGMTARISGTREADQASGTFVVEAGGEMMDYGDWRLTRKPPER